MFELKNQAAKLCNVNARCEKHGDENVLAVDLKIELKSANTTLDDFSDGLRRAFYWKREEGAVGELFEGFLPDVRFPEMPVVKWNKEFAGYSLRIESGIDDDSDINLDGCELGNFAFELQDGGTVVTTFRVQCHPDEEQAGHLLGKIQSEVTIDLTPPDPNAVPQERAHSLFDDEADRVEKTREDAITDAFMNGAPTEEEEA